MENDHYKNAHATFFILPVENELKSKEEGRLVCADVEHVRIQQRGDKHTVHTAPAHDRAVRDKETGQWLTYAELYPKQYEAFKDNVEFLGEGTPLSEIPFLTESRRKELRHLKVFTVEDLANLPDNAKKMLGMGGIDLMNKARHWVEKAKDSALEDKLMSENEALKRQLAELASRIDGLAPAPVKETSDKYGAMSDDQLKAFIKEESGSAPRGQPSRETLLNMARELKPVMA